jgi:hypothetical protein
VEWVEEETEDATFPSQAAPRSQKQPRASLTASETDGAASSGVGAEALEDVEGSASSGKPAAAHAGSGLAAAKALLLIRRYRLRRVKLPGGSIVTLPRFSHDGVNRYSMRAHHSCMVMVSKLEVAAGKSLLGEADTDDAPTLLSAKNLAGRFSEKPDVNGAVKLDLKPGTVLVTTGGIPSHVQDFRSSSSCLSVLALSPDPLPR